MTSKNSNYPNDQLSGPINMRLEHFVKSARGDRGIGLRAKTVSVYISWVISSDQVIFE